MTLRDDGLKRWLQQDLSDHGGFRHTLVLEDVTSRDEGLAAVARVVERAYEDAKNHLAELFATDLDPFGSDPLAQSYPSQLHTITLQGHLGEIFAGLFAENFEPHEVPWEVPVFLFRFSNAAIEGLERRLQLGGEATRAPGRTGDDCTAFLRDDDGRIVAWLNCEAKCTTSYPSTLIADGHRQLNRALVGPVSFYQLLDVLRDSHEPEDEAWVAALRIFRQDVNSPDPPTRADLFLCVCGQQPVSRATWMSPTAPHPAYIPAQPLEAVEVHLNDLDDVIVAAYPGHVINRA